MVKGSSRQVILVKSPEETMFEQAIFLVKEDALAGSGVSTESVLAQAQKLANNYGKKESIFTSTGGIHVGLWVLLGASGASFCWAVGLCFLL
ncbi:MAG: translation initiation factor 2 [Eubacteriales bacterium]